MIGVIQSAIHKAQRFSGDGIPSVVSHLAGMPEQHSDLSAANVTLNRKLMQQAEDFIEQAGVDLSKGLTVLQAQQAAEAIVLEGKTQDGEPVVVKLTNRLGVYNPKSHPHGKALHLDEPAMQPAVQTILPSMLGDDAQVLVRVEPKMLTADKVIAAFAGDQQEEMISAFNKVMRQRFKDKGLSAFDAKPDGFGIAANGPVPQNLEQLLARDDLKMIDVGAAKIPDPEFVKGLDKPVFYKPHYHEAVPQHISEVMLKVELPPLSGVTALPATAAAEQYNATGQGLV